MDGSVKAFKQITIFENAWRLSRLVDFRERIIEYLNNLQIENAARNQELDLKAAQLRTEINQQMRQARAYIQLAGVGTEGRRYPAPLYGGAILDIDFVADFFRLREMEIPEITLIDMLDRSIGVYANDRPFATLRTVNPFWWLAQLVGWIASIPFMIFNAAGFETARIEQSVVGKTVRLVVWIGGAAASFVALMPYWPF